MQKELTCICCPLGCLLTAELQDGRVITVSGNSCPRGQEYAEKELVHPTRILTSTIKVLQGELPVVSVKTTKDIPKEKMEECMQLIRSAAANAPVHSGDVLIENAAETGADIIATKTVEYNRSAKTL